MEDLLCLCLFILLNGHILFVYILQSLAGIVVTYSFLKRQEEKTEQKFYCDEVKFFQ